MSDVASIAELHQLVQRIALISHVSGTSYEGKIARDTSDGIGGRRPAGSDHEPKPRQPKIPLIEGNAASEKVWDGYMEDLAAWQLCYQRRTPEYFRRRLERCHSDAALQALVVEARETLEAWKRTPIPAGQEPEFGSPQWKRYIGESREAAEVLANRFFCTPRYIRKVRKAQREGGLMPLEKRRKRDLLSRPAGN